MLLTIIAMCDVMPPLTAEQRKNLEAFEKRKAELEAHPPAAESAKLAIQRINKEGPSKESSQRVEEVINPITDPQSLSALALWAQEQEPWLISKNPINYLVFATAVQKLGKSQDPHAAKELQHIEMTLKQRNHFDGRLAELVTENEELQQPDDWISKLRHRFF